MIITNRFVVLNNPKTGSTFFRSMMRHLHPGEAGPQPWPLRGWRRLAPTTPPFLELLHPKAFSQGMDQHGSYAQIPRRFRGRPVVSVVRDPFDRFLSVYRFRWWAEHPAIDGRLVLERFPHFPNLDPEEYLRFEDLFVEIRLGRSDLEVGRQTIQFIRMFFPDPERVLRRLAHGGLDSEEILEELPPIRLLQTEELNRQLFDFLLGQGYPRNRVQFILGHPRVHVTDAARAEAGHLRGRVAHRERLLYRIYRSLGIVYPTSGGTEESTVTPR
jgi:hypothetical protein